MVNGDSDRDHSQSKRPPFSQHDSDSQYSDQSHGHGHHGTQQHRRTKHVVGGGSRLHARVPSSKALHKSHSSTSSAKLNRRQASPSPERMFAPPSATPAHSHRRATSDVSLSREPSTTNLRKNASHTSLKRNRSKVEVGKKSKSTTSLKSAGAQHHAPVNKHIKAVNQVHFNLGDEEDDEEDEGEWVDASTSASPLLSRRTSVVSSGQQSATNSRPATAQEQRKPETIRPDKPPNDGAHSPDPDTTKHKQYLTSRILERSGAQQAAAAPIMSKEHISVRNVSSRHHSPDSPHSGSTLADTPGQSQVRLGSSGKVAELSSRFVHNSGSSGQDNVTSRFVHQSTGSGPGADLDAFGAAATAGALKRAAEARNGSTSAQAPRRPKSTTDLANAQKEALKAQMQREEDEEDKEENVADKLGGIVAVTRNRSKRTKTNTPYTTNQVEMNRTQQKLNLQRASSTLEQAVPHPGLSMGLPAATSAPYRSRDAVVPKVLEKTGMEYLVVRRYQHPVARSLRRLQQIPGADKHRHIPKAGHSRAQSRAGSEYNGVGMRSGPVMNLQLREQREGNTSPTTTSSRDSHREPGVVGLISGRIDRDRRPGSRRGGYPGLGINGGVNGDDGAAMSRVDERTATGGLSGASLVDGSEDAHTLATLRNLWDRNMDLSASQD